jgi:Protein of unknown function (DUF1682)
MKAIRWLTAVVLLCCVVATVAVPWDRKNSDPAQDLVVETVPESIGASSSAASEFAAASTAADATPTKPDAGAKPSRARPTPPSQSALLVEMLGFTACALFLVQYILGELITLCAPVAPAAALLQQMLNCTPLASALRVVISEHSCTHATCCLLTRAGKGDNTRIAKAWSDAFHPLFSEQFEQAGPAGAEPAAAAAVQSGALAMRAVSAHNFVYYATGRVGCRSMTVTLDLKARQDMVSSAMAMVVPGKKDSLTVEVCVLTYTCALSTSEYCLQCMKCEATNDSPTMMHQHCVS